jgi:hypothetical protein
MYQQHETPQMYNVNNRKNRMLSNMLTSKISGQTSQIKIQMQLIGGKNGH